MIFLFSKSSLKESNQSGVGLIEVLVTLLILSTALLALGAMQNKSLQFNQGAYMRSQANILAYDLMDRVRVNLRNLKDYKSAEAGPSSSPVTSPLTAADIDNWRINISRQLPDGKGGVSCVAATNVCTVTISWRELNNSGEVDEDKTTFTYEARM